MYVNVTTNESKLGSRTGLPAVPQFQTLCLVLGGFLLHPATMRWWRDPGTITGLNPLNQNLDSRHG